MATYVYETVPSDPAATPERFEVVQSMRDRPLARHPQTGVPVRRVVSGGFGLISRAGASTPTAAPAAACSPGCTCHRGPRIPSLS